MNLTDEELARLNLVTSLAEWDQVVADIRRRRGGDYPPDWYREVKETGIMKMVFKRWGGSPQTSFEFPEGK